ncbi:hypothetical protein BPAE_0241g00030 [Botrytis paeoniae]|uniref:Uncharacterized protein n=1 Tax=Botrytis paeoniae TaxID=278948 RepID=A0A4Z1F8L2_9HELO|nr:hypothetical protein BPAE_0241g00030 [Botrytis paeoniae]
MQTNDLCSIDRAVSSYAPRFPDLPLNVLCLYGEPDRTRNVYQMWYTIAGSWRDIVHKYDEAGGREKRRNLSQEETDDIRLDGSDANISKDRHADV